MFAVVGSDPTTQIKNAEHAAGFVEVNELVDRFFKNTERTQRSLSIPLNKLYS